MISKTHHCRCLKGRQLRMIRKRHHPLCSLRTVLLIFDHFSIVPVLRVLQLFFPPYVEKLFEFRLDMISTLHTTRTMHTMHTILVILEMQYMGNEPFVEYFEQGKAIISPCPHEHRDLLGSTSIPSIRRS